MNTINRWFLLILPFVLMACDSRHVPVDILSTAHADCEVNIESPSTRNRICLKIENEIPVYSVFHNGRQIIKPSPLGFVFKATGRFQAGLKIVDFIKNAEDRAWVQVWGEKLFIRDYYTKADINLQETTGLQRRVQLQFRAYDDGIAFRYIYPQQGLANVVIMDELTEFRLAEDGTAWWIPAYQKGRYNYLTTESPISSIDNVHTPLTLKTNSGVYLSFHEAGLVDYASMTLLRTEGTTLKSDLVPWADGDRVKTTGSFKTPWRSLQIADEPGELISSYLILNLNEPNKLADTEWIKPYRYLRVDLGDLNNNQQNSHHQAATTQNAKYHIDYCKKLGIDHLLITGWQEKKTSPNTGPLSLEYSAIKAVPAFNLNEVIEYGKAQGVGVVGYHETGANITRYLAQVDAGMYLYRSLGIDDLAIEQGGSRFDNTEWPDGQFGVSYYRKILEKAVQHKLMISFHKSIKDTGERRTYPNMMTRDSARTQAFDRNGEATPPPHYTATVPFTRMLAGPIDFSLGIIGGNVGASAGADKHTNKNAGKDGSAANVNPLVHSTLAKQLALYVVLYSPVQMLADSPEHYEGHPALPFLREVPVDWANTKVINASIGEYVTIARKDRRSENWYLGSISNEKSRVFNLRLDFLDQGVEYRVKIYEDVQGTSWDKNGGKLNIVEQMVNSNNTLTINLVSGGGAAMIFYKQ